MTGLDTNVLLRYLVQDDPGQSKLANNAIARLNTENPGFVSMVVLCELNWSLRRAYKLPKPDRIGILDRILATAEFEIEQKRLCRRALTAYRNGAADFADYLIKEVAHASGCTTVLTFDKAALKSPGFTAPK